MDREPRMTWPYAAKVAMGFVASFTAFILGLIAIIGGIATRDWAPTLVGFILLIAVFTFWFKYLGDDE